MLIPGLKYNPFLVNFNSFLGSQADAGTTLPIRQTASIFKQPVTVVHSHPESQTNRDLKHGSQDPPQQVCAL